MIFLLVFIIIAAIICFAFVIKKGDTGIQVVKKIALTIIVLFLALVVSTLLFVGISK